MVFIDTEDLYEDFKKYYKIMDYVDTYEKEKSTWIICKEIANIIGVKTEELLQRITDEEREKEYDRWG